MIQTTKMEGNLNSKVSEKMLKLYHDDLFFDTIISVGGTEFRVHKAILATSSTYFYQQLSSIANQEKNKKQKNGSELMKIEIDRFSQESEETQKYHMELILKFIYTGELAIDLNSPIKDVNGENDTLSHSIFSLFRYSDYFGMPELEKSILELIQNQLKPVQMGLLLKKLDQHYSPSPRGIFSLEKFSLLKDEIIAKVAQSFENPKISSEMLQTINLHLLSCVALHSCFKNIKYNREKFTQAFVSNKYLRRNSNQDDPTPLELDSNTLTQIIWVFDINLKTATTLFRQSVRYNSDDLKQKCLRFIQQKFNSLDPKHIARDLEFDHILKIFKELDQKLDFHLVFLIFRNYFENKDQWDDNNDKREGEDNLDVEYIKIDETHETKSQIKEFWEIVPLDQLPRVDVLDFAKLEYVDKDLRLSALWNWINKHPTETNSQGSDTQQSFSWQIQEIPQVQLSKNLFRVTTTACKGRSIIAQTQESLQLGVKNIFKVVIGDNEDCHYSSIGVVDRLPSNQLTNETDFDLQKKSGCVYQYIQGSLPYNAKTYAGYRKAKNGDEIEVIADYTEPNRGVNVSFAINGKPVSKPPAFSGVKGKDLCFAAELNCSRSGYIQIL